MMLPFTRCSWPVRIRAQRPDDISDARCPLAAACMHEPSNKGMKLSKPEYLVGSSPVRTGIIESGFAAYAQCCADCPE
jgi:hypothetical protein